MKRWVDRPADVDRLSLPTVYECRWLQGGPLAQAAFLPMRRSIMFDLQRG